MYSQGSAAGLRTNTDILTQAGSASPPGTSARTRALQAGQEEHGAVSPCCRPLPKEPASSCGEALGLHLPGSVSRGFQPQMPSKAWDLGLYPSAWRRQEAARRPGPLQTSPAACRTWLLWPAAHMWRALLYSPQEVLNQVRPCLRMPIKHMFLETSFLIHAHTCIILHVTISHLLGREDSRPAVSTPPPPLLPFHPRVNHFSQITSFLPFRHAHLILTTSYYSIILILTWWVLVSFTKWSIVYFSSLCFSQLTAHEMTYTALMHSFRVATCNSLCENTTIHSPIC